MQSPPLTVIDRSFPSVLARYWHAVRVDVDLSALAGWPEA
jgi:hypothetical protein